MKKTHLSLLITFTVCFYCLGQGNLSQVKSRKFKTSEGLKIEGQVGFLEVPENRGKPSSRKIKLKYVHLRSLSKNPASPVVYLEGGGGVSTWEASSPRDLDDRIKLLESADLIFLDRRGSSDKALNYLWKGHIPEDFFLTEEKATQHYQEMSQAALNSFKKSQIDISGYHIEAHAHDVHDLMVALGIDRYSLFGFSYGSHIAMTVMKLFPGQVERAVLVGADAPNQAFNFPSHLDKHVEKIGALVEQDSTLNMTAQGFVDLVHGTITRLSENPVTVTVKHPLTKKEIDLQIGEFGLALILRLDIDDYYDIPVIPRLLHSINSGDYSILTWFVQKRMVLALGLPGQGINQQLASGVTPERWSRIKKEASNSVFGNVVNFPFSAVRETWPETKLSLDPSVPTETEIPTLFITGTLDCRTPVEQVELIMQGFTNAAHVRVENAGHEQAQWDGEVADTLIPSFIRGERVESMTVYYSNLMFLPILGAASGHPSID